MRHYTRSFTDSDSGRKIKFPIADLNRKSGNRQSKRLGALAEYEDVDMRLDELAQKIGAKMINNNKRADVEITRYYAGDKISELLTKACAGTLVVGNIVNPHIFRVAELLDVPAICLLNNFVPEQEMINAANEYCTILMVSPVDKSETLSRLTECLGKKARIDL